MILYKYKIIILYNYKIMILCNYTIIAMLLTATSYNNISMLITHHPPGSVINHYIT